MGANDTLLVPFYGYAFRVGPYPILDADGDLVTGATTPDAEISKDFGTFADCTNEGTEVATSSGMYYLDLSSTEMQAAVVSIIQKSATAGAKTTPISFATVRPIPIATGTAQAGAAGTITLAAGEPAANDFYNGCFVGTTGGTGPGQVRRITDYAGATQVATVAPNWTTTPDVTTTYEIILSPEAASAVAWAGTKVDDPVAVGVPDVQVKGIDANAITATAINTGAITAAKFAAGAIDATAIANGAIDAATFAAGAIDAAALAADAGTEIAAAVWDRDATASQTQGSFGQAIGDPAADASTIWDLANTNLDAAMSTRATPAQVKTQMTDALNVDTYAESAGVPAATATLVAKISWLATKARNKITQTATTQTLRNDADSGNIATSTVSDDGTTATVAEWV